MPALHIARTILYGKDVSHVAEFYERHFEMRRLSGRTEEWIELTTPAGTCSIALHKGGAAQKSGAAIKLVFGVEDVSGFNKARAQEGLKFGVILEHKRPCRKLDTDFEPRTS
jgi:hypothetical protein